jgi:putative membrane protein
MTPSFHLHLDVWALIAVLALGYELAVKRMGPRMVHPIERVVTSRQRRLFYGGLSALWLAADWPVHDLAEQYLYSVHMVQHLLISLVAVPLLLLGTPDWLLRRLLRPVLPAARFFGRPIIALVVFNSVIAGTHIPAVVDVSTRSELAHFTIHAVLFGAAACMWLPVLNKLIELPKLSYPGRMFYLFLMSLVPTVPASFLTFGHTVLYRFYETAPRIWPMDALTDQRIAGLIMKLVGGFLLWVVIAWYFFKWFSVEEREGVDVLEWSKLDRDLNRAEPVQR